MNGSPPRQPHSAGTPPAPGQSPARGAELLSGVGKTVYEFSGGAGGRPGDAGDPGQSRTLFAERDFALQINERPQESNLRAGKGTGLIFFLAIAVLGGGITFGLVAMGDDAPTASATTTGAALANSTASTPGPAQAAVNPTTIPAVEVPTTGTTPSAPSTTPSANLPVKPSGQPSTNPASTTETDKKPASGTTKKPSTKKDPPKKDPPKTPSGGLKPKKPPKKGTTLDDLPDPG